MNHTKYKYDLRLLARNEGKIKSYESCYDIRAWSHDVSLKDQYLRDWMKCDMPPSVLPMSTLACFLRAMTCRSRRRVSPRCHPDCKSKILLESICNSCHAMRECLKQDDNFDKYFVEEELETSKWPCDRCLEALKSIKMFWKVITDKVFRINVSKFQEFEPCCCDSVKSIANVWQAEMVQQALYVKNITPTSERKSTCCRTSNPTRSSTRESSQRTIKSCPQTRCALNETKLQPKLKDGCKIVAPKIATCNKICKTTSTDIKFKDIGCDTCFKDKDNEEICAYKMNVKVLQEKCDLHEFEMERLRKENTSLKIELENVYKGCSWKAAFYRPKYCDKNSNTVALIPKPFDCLEEECKNPAENIDSEMVITMKNGQNDSYKHVALLQVLHKTNSPLTEDLSFGKVGGKKEDPIAVLTKVQNTFGAIVRREMSLVNEKKQQCPKCSLKPGIETTFHKINTHSCRSAPSCSTMSSTISSDLNIVTSNDVCDSMFSNAINV